MNVDELLTTAELPEVAVSTDAALERTVRRGTARRHRRRAVAGVATAVVLIAMASTAIVVAGDDSERVATGGGDQHPPSSSSSPEGPAAPLSARIVMSSTTMSAGAIVDAEVIVENNTGKDLEVVGCGSVFQVALASDTIEPSVPWLGCAQPLTVPVGESTYSVEVRASYLTCSTGGDGPACVDGHPPALPPGVYEARLYQSTAIVPEPRPIEVRVTP